MRSGGDAGEARVRDGGLGVDQLRRRMRVAVERKDATRCEGIRGQGVVEVLPRRIAVDLDRDARAGGSREHDLPVRDDAGARAGDSAARVREDVNGWILDGRDEPRRLVLVPAQPRMRSGKNDFKGARFLG